MCSLIGNKIVNQVDNPKLCVVRPNVQINKDFKKFQQNSQSHLDEMAFLYTFAPQ